VADLAGRKSHATIQSVLQFGWLQGEAGLSPALDRCCAAASLIWAIAEGREAARQIDHYLTGESSTLRARDRSLV
jgi:NADPH-dependent glutamate synthase beta subunit-like oxidoreductase